MAKVVALGHVGVESTDVKRWQRWGEHLGAMIIDGDRDSLGLRLDSEAAKRIVVDRADQDALAYAGWEVDGPKELDIIHERLEAVGTAVEIRDDLAAERSTEGLIRFADPDGFVTEIYWGRRNVVRSRFLSPHGVDFSIGDLGLGHLVYGVADFHRSLDFYTNALGMVLTEIADVGGNRVAMLRCNGRHHSLALVQVPSAPRVLHFAVEVSHFDALGAIRDRLMDDGFPISRDLGRHPGDGVISFYQPMGDAFEVEVAWGTIIVDEATWDQERFDRKYWAWGHRAPSGAGGGLGTDVN